MIAAPADPSIERSIRDTAYYLWEIDGRPEGRDQEYWNRAREAWLGQQTLDSAFENAIQELDPEIEPTYRPVGAGGQ